MGETERQILAAIAVADRTLGDRVLVGCARLRDAHRYVDVLFFVPGSNTPALTTGFGAVFTDVDLADVTRIQFFGINNNPLADRFVLDTPGNETLSFLELTSMLRSFPGCGSRAETRPLDRMKCPVRWTSSSWTTSFTASRLLPPLSYPSPVL
jgi:hypothetical protein